MKTKHLKISKTSRVRFDSNSVSKSGKSDPTTTSQTTHPTITYLCSVR
ncbi:hypothetical protein [Sphingobacterium sp.]|nr:hypothetical protein [Sphingobacterium sp.]